MLIKGLYCPSLITNRTISTSPASSHCTMFNIHKFSEYKYKYKMYHTIYSLLDSTIIPQHKSSTSTRKNIARMGQNERSEGRYGAKGSCIFFTSRGKTIPIFDDTNWNGFIFLSFLLLLKFRCLLVLLQDQRFSYSILLMGVFDTLLLK